MIYSEVYRVLWRRKLLVGGGTLLCLVLAFIVTAQQQKLYTATATVRVEPLRAGSANDNFEASQRLSRSYAQIYTQGASIGRMARLMLGQPAPKTSELAAHQVKDLDLLAVSGVASSKSRALAIANAGARALEDFSRTERLVLISPPTLPSSPSSPNLKMNLLLAIVGGFILSAGIALAVNAIVQPIGRPEDLEQELGVPVLATIPPLRLTAWRGATEAPPPAERVLSERRRGSGERA